MTRINGYLENEYLKAVAESNRLRITLELTDLSGSMFGYVWRLVWKTKFRVVAKDAKTMIGSGQSGMAEHSITA